MNHSDDIIHIKFFWWHHNHYTKTWHARLVLYNYRWYNWLKKTKCLNNYFKITPIHFYRIIKWCILLSIVLMLVLKVGQKLLIILHKLIVIQNSLRWHPYQSGRVIFTNWWQLDQYFSYITIKTQKNFKFGRYFGIVCNHSIVSLIENFGNL